MKKITALILTLTAVFAFAGCKKKSKKTLKTTTGNQTTTKAANPWATPDVEGNLIENGNFNYGERETADSGDCILKCDNGGEWWVYSLNGGFGVFDINEKRQIVVGVRSNGNDMHCVQLAYDGAMITKGSKYVFEFDAMASENRHFEIRI